MTFPEVSLEDSPPLLDYYYDRYDNYYSVARLVEAAKDLETFELPLLGIDLSAIIWSGANLYQLAIHCKKVNSSDLEIPIILDWYGYIADGRHRVIKALVEGKATIKAKRLIEKLTPCGKDTDG
jgi:hypothetical protein